jgi:hypothetical protein
MIMVMLKVRRSLVQSNREAGFGALVVLLILFVFALACFAGWRAWQSHVDKNKSYQGSGSIDLAYRVNLASPLPQGWVAETKETSRMVVKSDSRKCFADVMVTSDTTESNSPGVSQHKQTVDGLKSKGYDVDELSAPKLTINTTGGEQQINSQILHLSGQDDVFHQYAYITKPDSYTRIQLSCPTEGNLQSARAALRAIRISL